MGHCAACSTGQLWIYDGRCRAGWHAPWPWQTSRARILKHCILTSHLPHLQTWSKWEKEKIADMGSASSDFLSMLVDCKALSALLVGPFPSLCFCPVSSFVFYRGRYLAENRLPPMPALRRRGRRQSPRAILLSILFALLYCLTPAALLFHAVLPPDSFASPS